MNTLQNIYYAKLHLKARKGRTLGEAVKWLESNYTGDSRKAIRHQMDTESWKTTVELMLLNVYKTLYTKK